MYMTMRDKLLKKFSDIGVCVRLESSIVGYEVILPGGKTHVNRPECASEAPRSARGC